MPLQLQSFGIASDLTRIAHQFPDKWCPHSLPWPSTAVSPDEIKSVDAPAYFCYIFIRSVRRFRFGRCTRAICIGGLRHSVSISTLAHNINN